MVFEKRNGFRNEAQMQTHMDLSKTNATRKTEPKGRQEKFKSRPRRSMPITNETERTKRDQNKTTKAIRQS